MARFPDLNNPYREWDIPELPSWISRGAKQFMSTDTIGNLLTAGPGNFPGDSAVATSYKRWPEPALASARRIRLRCER